VRPCAPSAATANPDVAPGGPLCGTSGKCRVRRRRCRRSHPHVTIGITARPGSSDMYRAGRSPCRSSGDECQLPAAASAQAQNAGCAAPVAVGRGVLPDASGTCDAPPVTPQPRAAGYSPGGGLTLGPVRRPAPRVCSRYGPRAASPRPRGSARTGGVGPRRDAEQATPPARSDGVSLTRGGSP
jgi:hypothetical protein